MLIPPIRFDPPTPGQSGRPILSDTITIFATILPTTQGFSRYVPGLLGIQKTEPLNLSGMPKAAGLCQWTSGEEPIYVAHCNHQLILFLNTRPLKDQTLVSPTSNGSEVNPGVLGHSLLGQVRLRIHLRWALA